MVKKVDVSDELVASLEEGLAILSGKAPVGRVHLPPATKEADRPIEKDKADPQH